MTKDSKMPMFRTVAEFQGIIGSVSKAQIYNEIKLGKIPIVRIGTKVLIPQRFIDEFCCSAKCMEMK